MPRKELRTKPYKAITNTELRITLTPMNLLLLNQLQMEQQEKRGRKISASTLINECIHQQLSY
ncbi:hypothetical protein [Aliiglaciecola lipolytica]|uniref:hypothetical protein n=1 Tax=Aliiglaciecola lipolytica TaxID=477689 RepID=UPI001C08243C|nr:hypothetical protein [Aliiglaciecola lipolytica]MBU2877592.1 hypothetical protein [Aliiglaciecola lipolytica]